MFNPLPFQKDTIDKLLFTFTELWKKTATNCLWFSNRQQEAVKLL